MGKPFRFINAMVAATVVVSTQTASASDPVGKAELTSLDAANQALVVRVKKQLVHLPGGTFEMGDWGNNDGLPYDMEPDSKPLHKVTLDGFSMMAYKVTYKDFDLFTERVGAAKINADIERFRPEARKPMRPAAVNWFGAKAFCQWLGKLSGLPFDLPTEAQWEYAARSGGKKLIFATDNGQIDEGRNYPARWGAGHESTPEVGFFPPNPVGLYGMLDYMALEWVDDWYRPDYYRYSPVINPRGPEDGARDERKPEFGPQKVARGLTASSPALGGFTFSRAARWPYRRELSVLREVDRLVTDPAEGYSNPAGPQFRCVLNQPNRSADVSSLDK